MKIHFGQWLDGYLPRLPINETKVDEAWVGPHGMLDLLLTRLGMSGVTVAEPERIGAYLNQIKAVVTADHFYAESWKVDQWGVARTILEWRDELVMGGWDGRRIRRGGPRLAAIAKVEACRASSLPAGRADWLNRVQVELNKRKGAVPEINRIELQEPYDDIPLVWRRIIACLQSGGVEIVDAPEPYCLANNDSDLATLQHCIASGNIETKGKIRGDGSLLLVRGRTPWESAEGLSAWLGARPRLAWPTDLVVIRGFDDDILDNALERYGVPTLGSSSSSPWRPAMQVLPLFLSLLWKPRDPSRMLELLMLPTSPIPRGIARRLANALSNAPGIGGPTWRYACDKAVKSAGDRGEVKKIINDWLSFEAFDPANGAPSSVVRQIARLVADWAWSLVAVSRDVERAAMLQTASAQARQLESILADLREEIVSRLFLERLLESITRSGSEMNLHDELSGSYPSFSSPGACISSADVVVWWGFCASASPPTPSVPWRSYERFACTKKGIALDDPATKQRAISRAWIKPLLAAKEKVVLVTFDSRGGEAESPHPVWHEIQARLNLDENSISRVSQKWTDFLDNSENRSRKHIFDWEPSVNQYSVPDPVKGKASWLIRPDLLGERKTESASSLELLFGCPLAWTLKYRAGIESGGIPDIPSGNLLYGRIAHTILEEVLLADSRELPTPEQASEMALERFDEVVAYEAATLLLPGERDNHDRVREIVGNAAKVLVNVLLRGGFRVKGCELELGPVDFAGCSTNGRADVVLLHPIKGEVIMDLKWSRGKDRRSSLEDGTALQLALYSHALRTNSKRKLPPAAYFIIESGRIFTLANDLFPEATVVKGQSLDQTLENAMATYRMIRKIFSNGNVLAPSRLEEDEPEYDLLTRVPMKIKEQCSFCSFGTFCGHNLGPM